MKHIIYILILALCYHTYGQAPIASPTDTVIIKQSALTELQKQSWWAKDYLQDTIPGISLDKAYNELLKNKKGQEIIVAVLDTKLDIKHEDIKNQIWINTNEIPNNGIDDDQNGYIDDIHGWDFLGNPKGDFVIYENIEIARIVRKYKAQFADKEKTDILPDQIQLYIQYKKAENLLSEKTVNNKKQYANLIKWEKNLKASKIILDSLHPTIQYTIQTLDSLQILHKNDSTLLKSIKSHKNKLTYNFTDESLHNYITGVKQKKETMLNPDFEEREITGDNPEDINDKYYGYNQVYGDVPFQHATSVTGVLAATRTNDIGIKGCSDNIKIMPVVMVASGDEHDKDVALAIRYAVDNGAKIINMSWGKDFSPNASWVQDAIKYAEKNDVLMITAAGNDGRSIELDTYYPNDYIDQKEFVSNFMVVGATDYKMDKNLIASFSNYGKNNVDVYAPGKNIYSSKIEHEYEFFNGTSLASPIVSGVAALIWSYYPKLTAKQVKQIVMQSGTSYAIDVEIEQQDDTKKLVPFTELSKSGKIVNAYNALLMAEKMMAAKN